MPECRPARGATMGAVYNRALATKVVSHTCVGIKVPTLCTYFGGKDDSGDGATNALETASKIPDIA